METGFTTVENQAMDRKDSKCSNSVRIDESAEIVVERSDSQLRITNDDNATSTVYKVFYKSKIFIAGVVFSSIVIIAMIVGFIVHNQLHNDTLKVDDNYSRKFKLPPEQKVWYDKGTQELYAALNIPINKRRAKNVILFVGDGMGPNTVTASRIYGFKENGLLTWERFPHMGLLKTYCADKQVPDSFSTATSLFGGVKTNYETGGVDSSVGLGNCSAALDDSHHVQTIFKWAQDDGMSTGFVTTTRVTHATPAALYSHVPDRRWECESKIPPESILAGCKDIGRQLVEESIGSKINIIMGGGRQTLVSNVNGSSADPIDTWSCYSKDGRNLIEEWKRRKEKSNERYAVVQNRGELLNLDGQNIDFLLGIFANGHLKYEHERDNSSLGMPSLKEMTLKALELLNRGDRGFLLVVEGGLIDQAHHRGAARKALSEVLALNEAVDATLKKMGARADDTLVIVTADHSHSLTINGYPNKGNNILGIAANSRSDNIPYTTLTYGTSNQGFETDENGKRVDPSTVDTTDWEYVQQAAINTHENLHGGSDVTVHANGPMAHLFHAVHEQSYVAHVIAYALRIGRFRDSTIAESLANLVPL